MIKAIIFDLDGVYLTRGAYLASKRFAEIFKAKESQCMPIFDEHLYAGGFISGKITEEEYWKRCLNGFNVEIDVSKLRKIVVSCFKPKKEVIEFVQKIGKKYKTALLTDMPREWMLDLEKKYNINKVFHASVVSGFVGTHKPNMDMYNMVLEKLKLKPEECVFIDDRPVNLPPARKLGMQTILFENLEQIAGELEKIGVRI